MRHVIDPATHLAHGHGPFGIRRIRPGLGIAPEDTGFGALGLVDRAHLKPGLVVGMHEHRNDEIVSYLRTGELTHQDSTGRTETIGQNRLMVMNAGSGFSHEERMPEGDDVHMLQIFVRPRAPDLAPGVQFAALDEADRIGRWRILVAPEGRPAPATVRQDVFVLDAHADAGTALDVPQRDGFDQWLYVFAGRVVLDDGAVLEEGAAIATSGESTASVRAEAASDLVLFQIAHDATVSMAGSLSRGR